MTDVDWAIERVVRVVDGDTIDVILSRPVGEIDGFEITATSLPDRPARLSPLHLDTPEEGDPGYGAAARDAADWFRYQSFHGGVRVTTYGKKDSFGRYLCDIYSVIDRADTFSRHMLTSAGWPPYVKGR